MNNVPSILTGGTECLLMVTVSPGNYPFSCVPAGISTTYPAFTRLSARILAAYSVI